MAEVTEQIIREAPEIEALKVGLIKSAQTLSQQPLTIPAYEAAGLSELQKQANTLAAQGIGSYAPFVQAGQGALEAGIGTLGQGITAAGGVNVAPQFNVAQGAMETGLGMARAFPGLATAAGAGLQDITAGTQAVGTAQGMIPYGADLRSAQSYLDLAARQAQAAGQLGAAPMVGAQPQVSTQGITGAQTAFAPSLQAYQMGPAQQVSAQQVGAPQMGAAQTGYAPSLAAYQMGPAQQVSTQSFAAPGSAEAYMSPYMQGVVDIQRREALRQADIAKQGRSAQAVRAGAFGGTREGVVEAEAQRNLAQQLGDIQAMGLQQSYQQAQQQFNAEQQARLAAQQANQAAGLTVGQQNLASALGVQQLGTQAGLQTALANLSSQQQANVQNQAAQLQAQGMNQQAALQAALANQQAGLTVGQQNLASQLGVQQLGTQTGLQTALANLTNEQQARIQSEANRLQAQGMNQQNALQTALANQQMAGQYGLTGAQLGMTGASQLAGIGSLLGQQGLSQAQLGQAGAGLLGQLGAQQAQLGLLPGQVAGQQANIYGQGIGAYGTLGQGIGSLAGQYGQLGLQQATTLGQLGQGLGQAGIQQATLGEATQKMGLQDISTLAALGATQQQAEQARLEAARATGLQQAMTPYQQLSFLSDIYKGAPGTQMALTAGTAPTTSPLLQAAGLGVAGLAAATGASKAGLF